MYYFCKTKLKIENKNEKDYWNLYCCYPCNWGI